MKKQIKIILIILLIVIIAIPLSFKIIGSANMKSKTISYLETKGCNESDIKDVKVEYSFMSKILSYREWSILVTFNAEPNVVYVFTYRDKEIVFSGVSDSQKEKDELKQLEDKFHNGELWN